MKDYQLIRSYYLLGEYPTETRDADTIILEVAQSGKACIHIGEKFSKYTNNGSNPHYLGYDTDKSLLSFRYKKGQMWESKEDAITAFESWLKQRCYPGKNTG